MSDDGIPRHWAETLPDGHRITTCSACNTNCTPDGPWPCRCCAQRTIRALQHRLHGLTPDGNQ